MNVQEQIKKYIAGQPEPKRSDMRELHRLTLQESSRGASTGSVPRARIGLATPAFSGPRSTNELPRHGSSLRFYGKVAALKRENGLRCWPRG
jgi:hypothetical protein